MPISLLQSQHTTSGICWPVSTSLAACRCFHGGPGAYRHFQARHNLREIRTAHMVTALGPEKLHAYFERISLPEDDKAEVLGGGLTIETLTSICIAHAEAIPFENLDLVYEPAKAASGGKISIQVDDIFDKLVIRRRGGYCFETNGLLTHVLRGLGFDLYLAAARVVLDKRPKNPNEIALTGLDHQVILVCLKDQWWVCDVGFGGGTPKLPVPLVDPLLSKDDIYRGGSHRVRRGVLARKQGLHEVESPPHKHGWYMQQFSYSRKMWHDLYFFGELEWRDADFEIPNFYCSNKHPLFCKQLVAALQLSDGRKTISGTKLRMKSSSGAQEHDVSDPKKLKEALEQHFGLIVPPR